MSAPVPYQLAAPKRRQHAYFPHTVRVLINMSTAGSALLPVTARFVITSGSGAPFAEVVYTWQNATEDEAALRAVLEALKIARRYQAQRVVVYIDNERAASIATGSGNIPREFIGLALQIRALAHTYKTFDVRYGMSVVAPTLLDFGGRTVPGGSEDAACAAANDGDPGSHYHPAEGCGRMSGMEDEAQEWTS
ncbi:MAG: hypothetical protein ACM3X3_00120 [Betaproteobacteria bacterium]